MYFQNNFKNKLKIIISNKTLKIIKYILIKNFYEYLQQNSITLFGQISHGILIIQKIKSISNFFFFLKKHTQTQFKVLADICGIDHVEKTERFCVFYTLLSISFNTRIILKKKIKEIKSLESITQFFSIACWFEREIWDLFGIFFTKHPDLRRILTDYGFKGHPLRKDFPLSGFFEQQYSHKAKRLVESPNSFSQFLRFFSNINTTTIYSKNAAVY